MPRFVKAESGTKNTVIYTDENGDQFMYSGGSRAWRNQNPGNLVPGSVSKRNGQIGVAKGFAIFPDRETGHKALLDLLKTTYGDRNIDQMIRAYAPGYENDTEKYLRFLRTKTGVKDNKKIKDFSADEFEKLWKAIERMEGWQEGAVNNITKQSGVGKKQIIRVRKNKKGTIVAYYVESFGWVSKTKGIKLAGEGKIDAVITISRAGNRYLKSCPDQDESNNLENLG